MSENPNFGATLFDLFNTPFAVKALNEQRLRILLDIGSRISFEYGAAAVRLFEPHIPWTEDFLAYRELSYRKTGDALAGRSGSDLKRYLANARVSFKSAVEK